MLHLGLEKGLANEATDTMLEALLFDEEETEEDRVRQAQGTSNGVASSLMSLWLEQTIVAEEEFDQHAVAIVKQVQLILTEFGKKRPKVTCSSSPIMCFVLNTRQKFLELINQIFVKKESRISALALLCDFFRLQPPHLHELMQTPLFDNLLQCLQIDTSTRVISLGITALIMFLPHIPIAAANHLPALFNIYSRLLFWDRERNAAEILPRNTTEVDVEDSDDVAEKSSEASKSWEKLPYLLESDDDSVPELLPYFTFLYGLYPLNFMDYVRKPQRYLRHANFPGSDDLDIEPAEIRQRSESFRQVHLLHPNFFTLTIESELSDKTRWMKTDSADVVAGCMALYIPSEDLQLQSRSRHRTDEVEAYYDVQFQSLLDSYESQDSLLRSDSPELYRKSGLRRNMSEDSHPMSLTAYSPSLPPQDDSSTLPIIGGASDHRLSEMLGSPKLTRGSMSRVRSEDSIATLALSDNEQDIDVEDYLEKVALKHEPRSPALHPAAQNDPQLKVKYLQREVKLMQNDLNFERYLSQQYQSHIGQLRSEQIQNARAEAETQNLINTNRNLKSKVEELQMTNTRMRVESEKSKEHSRKWDAQVTNKLKALREEQRTWAKEREELQDENERSQETIKILTNLVVQAESRELRAQQKLAIAGNLDLIDQLSEEVDRLKLQVTRSAAKEFAATKALEKEQEALRRVKILEMELESRDIELKKSKKAFEAELQAARLHVDQGPDEQQQGSIRDIIEKGVAELQDRNKGHEFHSKLLRQKLDDLSESHVKALAKVEKLEHPEIYAPPTPPDHKEFDPDEPYESDSDDDDTPLGPPLSGLGPLDAEPLGAALLQFQGRQRGSTNSSESSSMGAPGAPGSPGSPGSSRSNGSNASDAPLLAKFKTLAEADESSKAASKKSPLRYFEAPQPFAPPLFTPPSTSQSASTAKSNLQTGQTGEERRGSDSSETTSSKDGRTKVKAPKIGSESKLRQYGRGDIPLYSKLQRNAYEKLGGLQNVGLTDKAAKKAEEEERLAREKYHRQQSLNESGQSSQHQGEADDSPSDPEPKKAKRKLGSLRGIRGFMG
jgi:solute carrier family 25 protein 16